MIRFFGGTDIGLVRKTNQDRFEYGILSDTMGFAVLCDGMGGQKGGHVASEMATAHVSGMLRRDLREDMSELSIRSVLESAISGANALVYDAAGKDEALRGMGTTMVAAALIGRVLYISYVGDSRAYTATPEKETRLTRDHTVVQMLVDIGEISEEDAESHPKRHYITRAIGVAGRVDADFLVHTLAPGELVLLCSDGLYHYLDAGSLYPLLRLCVEEQSVDALIALARNGGGSDNITAVVAVASDAPPGGSALNG